MFDGWDVVAEAPAAEGFQLIEIAGRRFAIDAAAVVAAVEPMASAPVPNTPAWVRGVALWEGQVVPVLSIAERLGLPASSSRLLQLEIDGEPYFFEIDAVGKVITGVELERADEPLARGVIRVDDEAVCVLDLERVTDVSNEEVR